MNVFKKSGYVLLALILLISCKQSTESKNKSVVEKEFKIDFEKFSLDNGLQVIFHIDRSDPVVAVALTSHVGSAREIEGRTGFAHLFEHLLFLESENLGKGGLDKMSARIGGSGANGSTSRDRTNYFQTVPNDALEKMIWAEADKLGYFINTVTEPVMSKEKEIVKNEKRQRVDNQPHGHVGYILNKQMYPKNHPYSWAVIGSLEDLQNATLDDVKAFFKKWYVPNNVTLTIAGDFDPIQAKTWVKKYFDEIKRGDEIAKSKKRSAKLIANKNVYYEDNFARLPQLTFAWPGVYQYHEDAYALNVLTTYLIEGKKAPLYKSLVLENKLTDDIDFYSSNSELAGELVLSTSIFEGHNLNEANDAIAEGFASFEKNGIKEEDLMRIKTLQEIDFYRSLSSVSGKGFQLAQYEIFAGDPGYINQDAQNILAVTTDDVMRVYKKYLQNKPNIAISSVPKGKSELMLTNATLVEVVEEKIVDGSENSFDPSIAATYEKTPSSFDRSMEPPYGAVPTVKIPEVWKGELTNGMKLYGITNNEIPLVQFRMQLKGGMLLEDPAKIGVSNLLAPLLTKGTKDKTPEELENAIENLGAIISINSSNESIVISGVCLAKNYDETMALVEEMLLMPRWDQEEFDLLKQSTLNRLIRAQASANSIASNEFNKLIYGKAHILANNNLGTTTSVTAIGLEDLKNYYASNFSPSITNYHIVGDINQAVVQQTLERLAKNWENKVVIIPEIPTLTVNQKSKVYFYDLPGAKQSVVKFGAVGVAATDKNYYPLSVMNYRLGGGGFASQLTQQLREGKGYTYGIGSSFNGIGSTGMFQIGSGIRSNVTLDAAKLIQKILKDYGKNYNENDLSITKGFMIKSSARAFETLGSKLRMLNKISNFNYPDNYASERTALVEKMSVDDIKKLAEEYINVDQMIYLIVGDAETQLKKLNQLGYGDAILLNPPKKIKD